tara:strand:- start:243 stop:962 length:720 start_codon:yes stop_codon:yes gene_type:complete
MKNILITGCNGSIGQNLVKFYKKRGHNVIGIDLLPVDKKLLKAKSFFKCNLTSEKQLKKISKKIKLRFKSIDILINSAGYIHNELLIDFKNSFVTHKNSNWNKTINLNLNSVFLSTKYFLDLILASNEKNKVIINFSSVNSQGILGQGAYSASKKAVEVLTKVWSKELSPFKIRVACVSPGYINLQSTMENTSKKNRSKIINEIPLKKFGDLKDLISSIDFIIKNKYFNGKTLKIDGGL